MNPYETLGLAPAATDHQIKVAYRKLAKATHPDGHPDMDGTQFADVAKAYAILMDPEARKRFDETGSVDDVAPLTVRQHMITSIVALFNAALAAEAQRGTSLQHFDLMDVMRQNMKANLEKSRQQLNAFRKSVADRQVLLKRISRKDDGENLFADIIKQQLPELERLRTEADMSVRAMEMAMDELGHYKSEVELIQAVQMMQFGGMFSNQTGNSSVFTFR